MSEKKKKISFEKRKEMLIKSLISVENFLGKVKKINNGAKLYKILKSSR